jgi:type IV secretory pathway VirB10-like protein
MRIGFVSELCHMRPETLGRYGDLRGRAGGAADVASQAAAQAMSRFLNRLPTITIREGHRVKVFLTSDLELPAYTAAPGRF